MVVEIEVQQNKGVYLFPFQDNAVYSFTLKQGKYLLEVWGASGGNQTSGLSGQLLGEGGKGGYSRGVLEVKGPNLVLYCYVGGQGPSHQKGDPTVSKGGYNGGGASLYRSNWGGGTGGGGSTDICTIKSDIETIDGSTIRTTESYKSRIIVGGGGGGGWGGLDNWIQRMTSNGGNGGGFSSQGSGYMQSYGCGTNKCDNLIQGDPDLYAHSYNYVTGSTQTSTGTVGCGSNSNSYMNGAQSGSFGYGGSAKKSGANSGGGGGGGWYGGYGGTSGDNARGTGGAGGSGYVHSSSNSSSMSSLDSKYFLQEAQSFDGFSLFPSPFISNTNETGHIGKGYARITLLSTPKPIKKCSCFISHTPFFSPIMAPFLLS